MKKYEQQQNRLSEYIVSRTVAITLIVGIIYVYATQTA